MPIVETGPVCFESGRANWYAIYTRHQHEKAVAEYLRRIGQEVFLPLYTAVRQWKDRKKQLSLPLFPCYVFVHGNLQQRVRILSAPGVRSFVTLGGTAAPIPDGEIEAIQRVLKNPMCVEPHPFLRSGDRVRVISGPLAGIEGILVRRKVHCRLILSAELLEKSVAVEVDEASVEPLPCPAQTAEISRDCSRVIALPRTELPTSLSFRERIYP